MSERVTTELEAVIYEREGHIARIILNQPEKANTQSSAMVHDMEACLHDAERDYDGRVVILKARGNGFCAGHLIGRQGTAYEEFREAQEKVGSAWMPQFELFVWPVLHLWEFPKPIIAQVHGYASVVAPTSPCFRTSPSLPRTPTSRCHWFKDLAYLAAKR